MLCAMRHKYEANEVVLVGNVKKDLSPFAPGMLMVCSLYALEALSI